MTTRDGNVPQLPQARLTTLPLKLVREIDMPQVASGGREGGMGNARQWVLACAGLLAGAAFAQQDPVSVSLGNDGPGRPAPRLSLSALAPITGTALPGSVDVGLQWRQAISRQQTIDITAWRRLAPQPDALSLVQQQDTVYGARVEMKLKSTSAKTFFADKFIGMQLDSGARIGLKKSNGNPTIYYRNQF